MAELRTAAAVRSVRKRILYVEQNRDGTTGGSYRSLLFLLRELDRQAYAPAVAFYREHELLNDFRAAGCETLLLWHPDAVDLVSRTNALGAIGKVLRPLASVVQKPINAGGVSAILLIRNLWLLIVGGYDVLHLNNGVTVGAEFLIAAKLLGRRCVIHQRGITPVPKWCAWLARQADHVICVSEAARENLIAHGLRPDRCTAIHNGMDPDRLRRQIRRSVAEVRRELGIPAGCLVVGLAGMIKEWKGQMVLVEAMDRLHERHPDLRAVIMGGVSDRDPADQAYLQQIRDVIATRALGGCIILTGYRPNAPEYLQIFDIMVHTAIEPEPFSRVVIEGMALARPIVASATGGTPEAIQDGVSGLLVPANDPAALAERIEQLLHRPDLRDALGRAAYARVEDRFHIRSHVTRTQDIYRQLVGTVRSQNRA